MQFLTTVPVLLWKVPFNTFAYYIYISYELGIVGTWQKSSFRKNTILLLVQMISQKTAENK